jgi:hypothetical protein
MAAKKLAADKRDSDKENDNDTSNPDILGDTEDADVIF